MDEGYREHKHSKREELAGEGTCAQKQAMLRGYLVADATQANDAILKSLKGEQDSFNKYLAVSVDFFNNYLFGKDEENFKQVVIRGLITNYKPYVLPDADDASKSPVGRVAAEVKEAARAVMAGKAAGQVKAQAAHARKSSGKAESGEARWGEVYRVEDYGAFVKLECGSRGLAHFSKIPGARRGRVGLSVGNRVKCHVIGENDKGQLKLRVLK